MDLGDLNPYLAYRSTLLPMGYMQTRLLSPSPAGALPWVWCIPLSLPTLNLQKLEEAA